MNRRELGKGAVAVVAGTIAAPIAATRARKPATYILVHGTWLGGWIWADVAQRLRGAGHRVFTPTLTGVGERHHLIRPDIGLATHIADITGVIDYEDLRDVILVAHSFSGVAATGALDARRDRVRHIAFFDALIPHGARMSAVETNPDGSETASFAARRPTFIDGYQMVFEASYPMKMLIDDTLPELQATVRRRLTPHPVRSWTDRLVLRNGGWEGVPRTAFRAVAQRFAPSSDKMWAPATGPGWQLIDLPCGRMGMMTDPDVVATAFARLAPA